jgi:thiamine-monophosphate kinase
MHEFDFIAQWMRPLTQGHADALGLADDAAVMSVPEGMELVLTKDVLHEGVHFVGDDPAGMIAQKALRTNLSDLAAMGAKPYGYLLGLGLPECVDEAWLAAFATGLAQDNTTFGVHVLGGDTTRTQGTLSISVTALGLVPRGCAIRRSCARAGDRLYVSGTLGDAAMGLCVARGHGWGVENRHHAWLRQRYLVPQPRLELGMQLRQIAHAAMDVSDGLLQDAQHMATASGVAIRIHRAMLPLSEAARAVITVDAAAWMHVVAGGDDYELLVALPADATVPDGLTCIGDVVVGEGVVLLDACGQDITPPRKGYQHF